MLAVLAVRTGCVPVSRRCGCSRRAGALHVMCLSRRILALDCALPSSQCSRGWLPPLLLQEMRERGIERNVHTFSALMNVCIKCGQYKLALDVYSDMRAAVSTPTHKMCNRNSFTSPERLLSPPSRALQLRHRTPWLHDCRAAWLACMPPQHPLASMHRALGKQLAPHRAARWITFDRTHS